MRIAMLSTSEIGEYPLTDVAFVSQDKFNMLTASDANLDAWVHIVLAKEAESRRAPPDVSNLLLKQGHGCGTRRRLPAVVAGNENTCSLSFPDEPEEKDPSTVALPENTIRKFNGVHYAWIGSPRPSVLAVVGQEVDAEEYARRWVLEDGTMINLGSGPELESQLVYESKAACRKWGPKQMIPDETFRVVYWNDSQNRISMRQSAAVRPHRTYPTYVYPSFEGGYQEADQFGRIHEEGPAEAVQKMTRDVERCGRGKGTGQGEGGRGTSVR